MTVPQILSEDIVLFSDGRRKLTNSPTYKQLRHWAKTGISIGRGPEATVIRLESVRMPTGKATSVEAYLRFLIALDAAERDR